MDIIRNFPLFTIILSLFSGVLCLVLDAKAARRYTLGYEGVILCLCGAVFWYAVRTGRAVTYVCGEFPAPWGNELRFGVLEAMMACGFIAVLICCVVAGGRYILQDIDESKINLYYALINLLTAALMAIVWTNDVFTGYVFLEILTLTSCGILIVREIGRTTLAAVRYMILNLMGSGLFLLGLVLLYDVTGNLLMVPMQEEIAQLMAQPHTAMVVTMATGILTMGLAIKSGLFPFHYWMPDAYGWATPTSGAIMSSLVSKCYIFLLFKIYYRAIGIEVFARMPIRYLLLALGMCGIIFGSVSALRAENINHMAAFSSAAQIGYIYMGLGLGGESGYAAAMFHILAHAVTKSLIFLTTPRLAEASGNSLRFRALQGSALRDRGAGMFFTVGALSMIGIPVFAGFSSKLLVAMAAADTGKGALMLSVILVLAVSAVLNAQYFIRTLIRIFGDSEDTADKTAYFREDFILPMAALTGMNLALGLFSWLFTDLIRMGLGMFG